MIGRLRGEILDRTQSLVVVDVNGVGYVVHVSRNASFRMGEQVDIFVHTHVREDAIHLFGFRDAMERQIFDLLISVPNIGPVKAMQILATPVQDLVALVAKRDAKALSKLPGVGKKTAERILVDLADKLPDLGPAAGAHRPVSTTGSIPISASQTERDLYSALINLGFKDQVAAETARRTIKKLGEDAGLEALLVEALSTKKK